MRVQQYTATARDIWNGFIEGAKNATFLFNRNYMEYHSDRFVDHSVMFFDENVLVAVMPANSKNGTLHSHGGLTFAGIISSRQMKMGVMLRLFDASGTLFASCTDGCPTSIMACLPRRTSTRCSVTARL